MNPRVPAATRRTTRPVFYLALACVYVLITVIGFSRRYFLPLSDGSFTAPAIVHVHGIITLGWVGFVVLQSALVATGRTSLHRSLGMAGIALGALLVFTATELVLLQLARGLKGDGPAPREFAALMLSTLVLIATLFGTAIAQVNRPEIHKRLMTLATIVILTPALARIIQLGAPSLSRLARNDLAVCASDALALGVIIIDARWRGRPHPAYLLGGAGIVAVQLAALLLRSTPLWRSANDWLASLVG